MGIGSCKDLNNGYFNDEIKIVEQKIDVIFRILPLNIFGKPKMVFHMISKPEDLVSEVIEKFMHRVGMSSKDLVFFGFIRNSNLKECLNLTINEISSCGKVNIIVNDAQNLIGAGTNYWLYKVINIKFIKISENINNKVSNSELTGLLKLCLLKEISSKLDYRRIKMLPELISYIMQTLKFGAINEYGFEIKETIRKVLQKMEGSNIINFSDFVDEIIDTKQMKRIMNLLYSDDFNEINYIKFLLSKYNNHIKLFNEKKKKAQKESIFEFSIISLVLMEREDLEKFEQEREKCPNLIDRILFHGTSIEPISCILTGLFNKSVDRCCQHWEGVYFTDFLDYCWFYGGEVSNRANRNKIPEVRENFTLIACSTYYNQKGFRKVKDYKYTPKKNEINFAYAGPNFETIFEPDFTKFVGTEYVIWDLDQICPFISAKLERNEYCVIWRDNNFSLEPVYNNKFDEIFKKF